MADKAFSVLLSDSDVKALEKLQDRMGKTMGKVSAASAIRAAIRMAVAAK